MTNGQKIAEVLRHAAAMAEHGQIDALLLKAARTEILNPGGDLYALWCDSCGDCATCGEQGNTDEAQLACIRRFLARECL